MDRNAEPHSWCGVRGSDRRKPHRLRLWPRSLLTPFTDNVRLTRADREAYRSYAVTERHKSAEHIDVTFDEPAAPPAGEPPG